MRMVIPIDGSPRGPRPGRCPQAAIRHGARAASRIERASSRPAQQAEHKAEQRHEARRMLHFRMDRQHHAVGVARHEQPDDHRHRHPAAGHPHAVACPGKDAPGRRQAHQQERHGHRQQPGRQREPAVAARQRHTVERRPCHRQRQHNQPAARYHARPGLPEAEHDQPGKHDAHPGRGMGQDGCKHGGLRWHAASLGGARSARERHAMNGGNGGANGPPGTQPAAVRTPASTTARCARSSRSNPSAVTGLPM
ncbi:hypothetical protein GO283_00948 [Ralstonia solanacearum]|nr:hypothetical protein LBM341_03630 [Ralstonia solanacearum]KAF3459633.1 hypothetical protein GO278_003881 [Ralstonia solanacearum]NJZ67592.1 hypothetical protein [Ralstonia solanacearum]NJZ79473.1 hypothetical protein [Ralstonia solanacearum]NJZ85950.1 hypothetical protein [Ralstonia solanacearum]